MTAGLDDPDWCAKVAAQLSSPLPVERRRAELRASLLARVHASALAHRQYRTVRIEDSPWESIAEGLTRRVLRSDPSVRVEMLRLAAGTEFPWPADADAQELLLLEGGLASTTWGPSPTGVPSARAYCVRQRSMHPPSLRAAEDTLVYVRQRLVGTDALAPLESRWWALPAPSAGWVDPERRRWHPSSAGVEVLPLRGDADVVSMLVRFAPGASVPDHGHAIDEDCLVLQGDMFLGDILLRAGDYQLAPAGGGHFGETSEPGVLFFFHGALDPVLKTGSSSK